MSALYTAGAIALWIVLGLALTGLLWLISRWMGKVELRPARKFAEGGKSGQGGRAGTGQVAHHDGEGV